MRQYLHVYINLKHDLVEGQSRVFFLLVYSERNVPVCTYKIVHVYEFNENVRTVLLLKFSCIEELRCLSCSTKTPNYNRQI